MTRNGYCLLLLLAWCSADKVLAGSIAELMAADRLRVITTLEPDGALVPGQRALLTVTVATDRWFTGGTRVTLPEVQGLTILEASQFAHNSSKREGANTWVLQHWRYEVYGHREGRFVIPSPRVHVEVSVEGPDVVAGELAAPPVAVSVQTPAELALVGEWVAAPHFAVTESFDRPLDQLQVGDVLVREVLLTATDTPAMLLPPVQFESAAGLATYPSTPVLENTRNRGQLDARRQEKVSYVIETAGEHHLPALRFSWWDTETGLARTILLPARQFKVAERAEGAAAVGVRSPGGLLIISAILGALLVARWQPEPLLRWLSRMQQDAARARATFWRPLPKELNPRPDPADRG